MVLALTGDEDEIAVDVLIELSKDMEAHDRDWATFGLVADYLDTPAIREALVDRLARSQIMRLVMKAITGLAERGDRRVIPTISEELASDYVENLVVEAATTIRRAGVLSALLARKRGLQDLVALRKTYEEAKSTGYRL